VALDTCGATLRTVTGTPIGSPVPVGEMSVGCCARAVSVAVVGPSSSLALKLADVPVVS
jgi:hypothetical protein